ncbi:serine/threonine protein kinase [Leucobacter coleopterorum]|uniref:non-specific serine/threonine protein kinase n=1 Tax=Leucobacter coleopterorum TaxID=2714933 RepID=A0ABX6JYJ0_9MICO|nr:serine/threonine-protein kinase [Leucobacter coleopterorum]QIM19361.1 serine/threonine protein kinase [Leucobacter coleopterorum]
MAERAQASVPAIPGFSYVRPLGSGGFAQVHLYEQDMPRRVVAVKVLNPSSNTAAAVAQLREVFESEADVMARLSSHPSVVSIYQASISLDGLPYLAMEYCPESMGARTKGNPVPLKDVLDAGVRIAGALETAHKAGVLHRDIKPSNVLLTTLGRPVLSDFGISQMIGQQEPGDGDVAMSIPWSAPEVVQLQTSGDVTSEVWALGATLYSFAAGRSPFELADKRLNTRSKLSERIVKAVYPSVPGAQGYEQFDELISRALRKNPHERFSSMAQFGEAIQELQRFYHFDVTPLEVVAESWLPRSESVQAGTRGPVVSAVAGRQTRAEVRAAALAEKRGMDSDGVVLDRPTSPLRAGLIGAGVALAGVAGIAAIVLAVWSGR